tara:strand:+ start:199 stop:369 length:171 start_codon:yes stop_codon:yes gene_type:complete
MCGRQELTCKQTKAATTAAPSPSHGYPNARLKITISPDVAKTKDRPVGENPAARNV